MIKALVFDFDGTLVDSNDVKRSAYYRASEHLPGAGRVLDQLFAEGFKGDRHEVFDELGRRLEVSPEGLAGRYGEICENTIRPMLELPELSGTLERFRGVGLKMFINSATPREALSAMVGASAVAEFFEGVYGGPAGKEENLMSIRTRHGYAADEILAIGDGDDDRRAAAAAGVRFRTVERGAQIPIASYADDLCHV